MTVILGKDQSTLIFSNGKTFSDYNVLIVYYHTKCDRHTQTLKFVEPFVWKFLPSMDCSLHDYHFDHAGWNF